MMTNRLELSIEEADLAAYCVNTMLRTASEQLDERAAEFLKALADLGDKFARLHRDLSVLGTPSIVQMPPKETVQ